MKKNLMLFVLMLMVLPITGNAASLMGDVDGDGLVKIYDVTTLINYLLTKNASQIVLENADVEPDGRISIDDVTGLIHLLLSKNNDPQPAEADWVDLGLPSGTLWATRNVGANSPEDYGDYFAWGETAPRGYYGWNTYKWCNGSYTTLTKYCTNSYYGYNGFTDGKTELDPVDDAAYINWGPSWRMPSLEQIKELINNCTWQWTQRNGVNGHLFTGPNGNTMFLPAAGFRLNVGFSSADTYGYYWLRTLYSSNPSKPQYAYNLHFYKKSVNWSNTTRDYGHTVRAVRISQN